MLRDRAIRLLFIPLLGIGISYISGIITYTNYNLIEKTGAVLYFILTSFIIWRGCQWLHMRFRGFYTDNQRYFSKLLFIIVISSLYGFAVSGFLGMFWIRVAKEVFEWGTLNKFILASVLAVMLFTLVYEILFLSKEREMDTQIVDQLDQELSEAEIMALRNEIDPHFIFNSLTALSQLIKQDSDKAVKFNSRLAEVYKYYLLHKSTRWIKIGKELEFVNNYFYLLKLRHGNKLRLLTDVREEHYEMFTIPCSIQVLVENAIKHNRFSEEDPLEIRIESCDQYIIVKNHHAPFTNPVESTRVGLRNLKSQYRIMAGKPLMISEDDQFFCVKVPLLSLAI
jgi:sensor histidine kinase YesM